MKVSTAERRKSHGFLVTVRCAAFLLVLWLLARHVSKYGSQLDAAIVPDGRWIMLAAIAAVLAQLGFAFLVAGLARGFGHPLTFGESIAACYLPMLGKYLPGRVATFIGALWVYRKLGLRPRTSAAMALYPTGIAVASGLLAALALGTPLVSSLIGMNDTLLWLSAIAVACTAPAGLRWALRQWPPATDTGEPWSQPSRLRVGVCLLSNIMVWMLYGGAWACLVSGFHPLESSHWWTVMSLFPLAQVAGFVAIFAPAGIGVREGVLIAGLAPLIGHPLAILSAAWCRIAQTVLESAWAAVGWWVISHRIDPRAVVVHGQKSSGTTGQSVE